MSEKMLQLVFALQYSEKKSKATIHVKQHR